MFATNKVQYNADGLSVLKIKHVRATVDPYIVTSVANLEIEDNDSSGGFQARCIWRIFNLASKIISSNDYDKLEHLSKTSVSIDRNVFHTSS